MVSEIGCRGGGRKKKATLNLAVKILKCKLAIARSVAGRRFKLSNLKSRSKNISSVTRHGVNDLDYTVDLSDLLCTPERDFLITNTGQKIKVDDLKGKTVVLFIVPVYHRRPWDVLDMVQAYEELLPFGGIEFVLVPVYLDDFTEAHHNNPYPTWLPLDSPQAFFDGLFSTTPFPAVPFSDAEACGDRVIETFSVDYEHLTDFAIPYWVIIDPTGKVEATRSWFPYHFKLFGGAELHPLSFDKICDLRDEFSCGDRCDERKLLISQWDQLLASPTRDYLLSSTGAQVPISSLKGKVIGLYFCENIPRPLNMGMIKEIYKEAKLRGHHDFEIVQINFHFHFFNAIHTETAILSEQQRYEDIGWLTLPFKDPSCRKLQRIFKCEDEDHWGGDSLVIVDDRRQAGEAEIPFHFSGVEVFDIYGIEGYPFTRKSLVDTEYKIQKRQLNLISLFPPGKCNLSRPAGDGSCVDGYSHLLQKRFVILFANQSECKSSKYISMLESKYRQQLHDTAEEDKFEVVYVSTDFTESPYAECIKDMPWLVHPYFKFSLDGMVLDIFKIFGGIGAAAFDKVGELIAKECNINLTSWAGIEKPPYNDQFPFISQKLREVISCEVDFMCEFDKYYNTDGF